MKNLENTTANKANFEVFEFSSGYFGIVEKGSMGAVCVFGGDSANEDDYNKEYINSIFKEWNGSINDFGMIEP